MAASVPGVYTGLGWTGHVCVAVLSNAMSGRLTGQIDTQRFSLMECMVWGSRGRGLCHVHRIGRTVPLTAKRSRRLQRTLGIGLRPALKCALKVRQTPRASAPRSSGLRGHWKIGGEDNWPSRDELTLSDKGTAVQNETLKSKRQMYRNIPRFLAE